MTATNTIDLPLDLRPRDGRFGSGPSKVRDEAVAALADAAHGYLGTSHRREGVKSVVRRIREGLTELFALPDGYEVLLANGGTTAFWDAAAFGLIERRSSHVVIGEFSSKFAAVTARAPHLDEPQVRETPPGEAPVPIDDVEGDVYAYPHNETSTGVMVPLHRPPGSDALVLVDATSAAGGLRANAAGFDVYYFAPQKCFASDGGLWLALCSPAALSRIERLKASGRWMPTTLDLSVAVENSRLDQTYNTPALATLFLLEHQLQWMLASGGLEFAARRSDTSAGIVYGWADAHEHATPFVRDPAYRSNVTATIDFDDAVDAAALAAALRANGIVDVEPYRKLGRNQLRIALFPSIEPEDVRVLTRAIDYLLERMTH
ncbi:MAG TPA: phosphoserine transaminase [Acidimicrobiia bacterium]|nr:phosphoserine transaminase [Acidimicrobiia bacterium]